MNVRYSTMYEFCIILIDFEINGYWNFYLEISLLHIYLVIIYFKDDSDGLTINLSVF